LNDKRVGKITREDANSVLISLFPACEKFLEDQEDFSPEEYALYNLSINLEFASKTL